MMNVTKEIVIKSPGIMEIWQILVGIDSVDSMAQNIQKAAHDKGQIQRVNRAGWTL